MCYSRTYTLDATYAEADSNRYPVMTTSWKFVGDYTSQDTDKFFNFYLDNSCIGDRISDPVMDPDSASSADDTRVTIGRYTLNMYLHCSFLLCVFLLLP
mmetsp:Transcript_10025/g.9690  ORF Transcript_10025/g.9690 Transcript_10025/m.9690 type:complete len:99 (-) Transcript_10025:39-335(-)